MQLEERFIYIRGAQHTALWPHVARGSHVCGPRDLPQYFFKNWSI